MQTPHSEAILRPLRKTEAPQVLAAFRSDPDMSRQGSVTNLEEAWSYVARLTAAGGPHSAFAVTPVDDEDDLIGLIAVTMDVADRVGRLWYWVHEAHRGSGLASRAAATVADWALSEGGCERLELSHRANNPASGGVATAAGFIQEGVAREKFLIDGERVNVYRYGRLRSDPQPTTEHLEMTD